MPDTIEKLNNYQEKYSLQTKQSLAAKAAPLLQELVCPTIDNISEHNDYFSNSAQKEKIHQNINMLTDAEFYSVIHFCHYFQITPAIFINAIFHKKLLTLQSELQKKINSVHKYYDYYGNKCIKNLYQQWQILVENTLMLKKLMSPSFSYPLLNPYVFFEAVLVDTLFSGDSHSEPVNVSELCQYFCKLYYPKPTLKQECHMYANILLLTNSIELRRAMLHTMPNYYGSLQTIPLEKTCLLNAAFISKNESLLNIFFSEAEAERSQRVLLKYYNQGKNLLHQSATNPQQLAFILKHLPKNFRLTAIKSCTIGLAQPQNVVELALPCCASLQLIFSKLTKQQGIDLITNAQPSLLHQAVLYQESFLFLANLIPRHKTALWQNLLNQTDRQGNSLLHLTASQDILFKFVQSKFITTKKRTEAMEVENHAGQSVNALLNEVESTTMHRTKCKL